MSAYTNNYISTIADVNTFGSIVLDYLTCAKYNVKIQLPAHPEIEISDTFNFIGRDTTINNIIIKRHTFDTMNWTSEFEGESFKKETT